MSNNARTNVILIVLALLVAGGAVYMLLAGGDNEPTVEATEAPGTEAERSFLALTAEIGAISFDTGIFSDPRFAALQDIRTQIVPEPAGRPDPFAPLSGVSAAPSQ